MLKIIRPQDEAHGAFMQSWRDQGGDTRTNDQFLQGRTPVGEVGRSAEEPHADSELGYGTNKSHGKSTPS